MSSKKEVLKDLIDGYAGDVELYAAALRNPELDFKHTIEILANMRTTAMKLYSAVADLTRVVSIEESLPERKCGE